MINFTAIPIRPNGPLFPDLLGRRVLYKGNKKKEQTIQVLYFCGGVGKEFDRSLVPCKYYEVNKKGKMNETEIKMMIYKELVKGINYKPKKKKKNNKQKKEAN